MEQTQNELAVDERPKKQSNELVEMADSFVIKDAMTFSQAVDLEKTLKAFLEGPGTFLDERIDQANKLHKDLCSMRNAVVDPVKKAWQSLKNRRATWQHEQDLKREEEQRKAEAEARRIEAEKQAKIQAKIDEENRILEEKLREEARIQAEKDAEIARVRNKAKAEEMRQAEEKRRAEEEARLQKEREIAEEKKFSLEEKKAAVYVAPKIVAPSFSAPAGLSVQFDYDPRIINKNIVPEQYKIVDVAMLKKMQKAAKGTLVVPGIDFIKVPIGRTGRV